MVSLHCLALLGIASFARLVLAVPVVGDVQCVDLMCIGALVNDTTIDYVMQSTGLVKAGWMATGFGTGMLDSPMVVMWTSSSGSVTLSQRLARDHSLPSVDSSPPRVATSSSFTSTSGTQPKFAYSMPRNSDSDIIWAFGTDQPSSDSPSASFNQHINSGVLAFDLTKSWSDIAFLTDPVESAGTAGGPVIPTSSSPSASRAGQPYMRYETIILAHAVICSVAFLVVLPAGVLLARYYRTVSASWFKGHWILQVGIALPLVIAGGALAASIKEAGGPRVMNRHTRLGAVILALYAFQVVLGAIIHFVKPKSGIRPPQNYFHAILGLSIITLAVVQVRFGMREWDLATARQTPKAVKIVWLIWAIILGLAYVLGLGFLRKQFAQEREYREKKAQAQANT